MLGPHAVEDAREVHRQGAVPLLERHLLGRQPRAADAGVVHRQLQGRAQTCDGVVDRLGDGVGVGDVHLDGQGFGALAPDPRGDVLGMLAMDVEHRDPGPFRREPQAAGLPDPRSAPGDQHRPALIAAHLGHRFLRSFGSGRSI